MTVETSTDVAKLAEALAKAQGAIKNAAATTENPMYRSHYADLAAVWSACREALSANGIAVVQMPTCDGEGVEVITTLLHSSGQWMRSTLWLPAERNDAQAVGSAITYARRYALAAIVGVAQSDDDGEAATFNPTRQPRLGGFVKEGVHATAPQLAALEELRQRAGIAICGDLLEVCPWHTKKYSKREGKTVDRDVLCAHHAELAQWKTAKQEAIRDPAQLTFEQADLLIARYRGKAERKERRAAMSPDVGALRPVALFSGDISRAGEDGSVEQLARGMIIEADMRTGALRVGGPVDGHATMPRAELDAGTVLRALAQSDMTETELCAQFGVEVIGDLTYGDIPDALCLIGDYGTERFELSVAKLRERQAATNG